MSESDLERELHRRGRELMQKLLQGHLEQRSPGEAAGPVAGADGVERRERRVHERAVETIYGTVQVGRVGYARAGHDSLHPLDASLNLPAERYSLEVRRRGGRSGRVAVVRRSVVRPVSPYRGPGSQASGGTVAARAAEDFDAFYEAPCGGGRAVARGCGCRAHLRRQGRGAASRGPARGYAAGGRAAAAATRAAFSVQSPQAGRLCGAPHRGEKKHAKRMATVAAVYTVAPFVRSPEEFLSSLMPRQPGNKTRAKARTQAVRPRPVAKRAWASL